MTTEQQPLTELQLKWVEALESGDYNQTTGALKYQGETSEGDDYVDSYCCLGVVCDLYEKGKWHDVGFRLNINEGGDYVDDSKGELPIAVANAFGFRSTDGHFSDGEVGDTTFRGQSTLIGLNDITHLSFAEIAAFVREHVSLVFIGPDEHGLEEQ